MRDDVKMKKFNLQQSKDDNSKCQENILGEVKNKILTSDFSNYRNYLFVL